MSDVLDRRHRMAQAAATAGVVLALAVGGTWGLTAAAQDDSTTTTETPAEESTTTVAPDTTEDTTETTEAPAEESPDDTTDTTEAPADDPAEDPAEDPTDEVVPAPDAPEPTPEMEAYRQCLADNGVTMPEKPANGERPDPSTMPDRETMHAAREACKDLLPPPPTEEEIEAYRQCLADNGVTMPERPANGERPDPSTMPDRETMQAAREACEDLRPAGGPGFGGPHGPGHHGPGGPGHHGPGGPGCDEDGDGTGGSGTAPEAPAEDEPSVEGSALTL